jgi:superfamily I DNA/RNA helicase
MTIHQAGRRAIVAAGIKLPNQADNRKAGRLVGNALDTLTGLSKEDRDELFAPLIKLMRFVRVGLIDIKDRWAVAETMDLQDIDVPIDIAMQLLPGMMEACTKEVRAGIIDFDDMIWAPNALNFAPQKFLWLFVDEAQDLSPASRELVLKMIDPRGGRALFVGDPQQAIMAFAGASNNSVDLIVERTGATKLPLSVCYRCPASHIALAQELVPHIQAAPGASEGVIGHISEQQVVSMAREGDLIMCRVTKHLISLVYEFIEAGIPARVLGREIGDNLVAQVKKVVKATKCGVDDFLEAQDGWVSGQVAKLVQVEGNESKAESLKDKASCLSSIIRSTRPASVDQLIVEINALFSNERASVTLCTIHKAKGLEADRTFILHPELLPHPMAKTIESKQQEIHLEYVAKTRAKQEMYFVISE